MNRYFIYIAYNGTRYCGWQTQPNGVSVQQYIEDKISILQRQPVFLVGAGRTDAGVHAMRMVAHFDLENPIEDLELLADKLNNMLSKDIAIERIVCVHENAHARFDALSRTYRYCISDCKNPFTYEWVYRMSLKEIDFERMNEACKILYGYADFSSFCKSHTDVKTHICRISFAQWKQEGGIWVFTIQSDRFLRNMVRAIIGTLFEVGRGKYTLSKFRQVIEDKNRCKAGTSVPAAGLSLVDISYPPTIFL